MGLTLPFSSTLGRGISAQPCTDDYFRQYFHLQLVLYGNFPYLDYWLCMAKFQEWAVMTLQKERMSHFMLQCFSLLLCIL